MTDPLAVDDALIDRYAAGECSPDEVERVTAWIGRDPLRQAQVARAKAVWEAARSPSGRWDVDQAWARARAAIDVSGVTHRPAAGGPGVSRWPSIPARTRVVYQRNARAAGRCVYRVQRWADGGDHRPGEAGIPDPRAHGFRYERSPDGQHRDTRRHDGMRSTNAKYGLSKGRTSALDRTLCGDFAEWCCGTVQPNQCSDRMQRRRPKVISRT